MSLKNKVKCFRTDEVCKVHKIVTFGILFKIDLVDFLINRNLNLLPKFTFLKKNENVEALCEKGKLGSCSLILTDTQ